MLLGIINSTSAGNHFRLLRYTMRLSLLLGFSLLATACSTTSQVISSDENHIAVVPPNNVMYEASRPGAAATEAQAHCQRYGKNAVLRDTQMSGGIVPRVVSVFFKCVKSSSR